MTFTYPAVFTKQADGSYTGMFPDLDGIAVAGETLEEVIRNARNAEDDWIRVELEEDEPCMPLISELEEIPLSENQIARQISVHFRFYEGWDE
ncbi:MAG: type II toxin-antitoxin system HicB family antitoxin [Lachnospiraceae bacterium]|nr:type II toxin-antitoxin system HicB family antitoxin [Lachnospiraceae bacterium]